MIVLPVEQGSAAWHAARLGIPTASEFGRILTPKTRKLASGRAGYMHALLASWLLGVDVDGAPTGTGGFIDRGTGMEGDARADYEFSEGITVERVGFVMDDSRSCGASPDSLVGADGGLEIKCPSAKVHVGNLLDPDAFADDHYAQVQGCMFLTGRRWWDLLSYHPTIPVVKVRIARDAEYLAALAPALAQFCAELSAGKSRLLALGCEPKPPPTDDDGDTTPEVAEDDRSGALAALDDNDSF